MPTEIDLILFAIQAGIKLRAAYQKAYIDSTAATALLGGCVVENARTIREAQAEFSRAAKVENRSLLGAEQGVQASTEASTNYRMAATTLDKLISDKGGDLKKDNLLCTAMVIEALSWWRLGDYDHALTIANNSSNCSDASLPAGSQPARELALFQALPGLIRIDQANQKLSAPAQTVAQFDEVMTLLANADAILQTARDDVGPGHPLQLYLIQSQLAVVRNWQSAFWKEEITGDFLDCETQETRQQCTKRLSKLACASLTVPPTSSADVIGYWRHVTGCELDPSVANANLQSCAHLDVKGGFPDTCPRPAH